MATNCKQCDVCLSCQTCNNCRSCDGCESCNSGCDAGCYNCDICISCGDADANNGNCDKCQSFCELGKQTADSLGLYDDFSFSSCVRAGELFDRGWSNSCTHFNKTTWDEIVDAINELNDYGSVGSHTQPPSVDSVSRGEYFTAEHFNEVRRALGLSTPNPSTNDKIYGSYFQALERAVPEIEIDRNRCESGLTCNTDCNSCNACQQCNNCQGCYAKCNDCINCDMTCDSCNKCQTCNSCNKCQMCDNEDIQEKE